MARDGAGAPRRRAVSAAGARLLTVGHSTRPVERLLELLLRHEATLLADIRSAPYSRRFPQFGRERLTASLAAAGIGYAFEGAALGGRPADPALWRDGRPDYGLMAAIPAFRAAIERLLARARQERVVLLCAEREPAACHRALLVAPALVAAGAAVDHILADGSLLPHAALAAAPARR